ncbi:unnamed protein product [Adineta steineri]|uniref:Uncharacterized protein n=1 Tax=Adineta steineri TaxID=433720 RepID=A0A813QEX0_9BILA|nr:unnamed protein product [Adineta steineri]CAF0923812.1 unnamed protein product [Adineta steineri]
MIDMKSYPRSKLSMLVFGSYMIIVGGIGFEFFPHTVLSLVGMTTTDNTFVRMFGLLAGLLGINYLVMVQQSAIIFFKLSIVLRYLAALFMIYLVVSGISSYNLLLFALGDILAATWTLIALQRDNRSNNSKSE